MGLGRAEVWTSAYCETCHLDFYPAGIPDESREARHRSYDPASGIQYVSFWLTECGHVFCEQHLSQSIRGEPSREDTVGRARCVLCRGTEVGVIRMSLNLPSSVASFFTDATDQSQRLFHAIQFQQTRLYELISYLKNRVVDLEATLRKKDDDLVDSTRRIRTLEKQVLSVAVGPTRRPVADSPRIASEHANRLDVSLLMPNGLDERSLNAPRPDHVPLVPAARSHARPPQMMERPDPHQRQSLNNDPALLKSRYSFRGDSMQPRSRAALSISRPGTADLGAFSRNRLVSPYSLNGSERDRPRAAGSYLSRPSTANGHGSRRRPSVSTGANLLSNEAGRSPPFTRSASTRPPTRSTFRPASRLA